MTSYSVRPRMTRIDVGYSHLFTGSVDLIPSAADEAEESHMFHPSTKKSNRSALPSTVGRNTPDSLSLLGQSHS